MSVRRELVKLAVFVLVAVALVGLLWSTLRNVTSGDTRTYVAHFTDVSGLHEGDSVRIAGVRVGRVDGMKLVGTHAEVTLSVRADQPVFENTRAVIRYQNLVGQRFVALVPGQGPARPLVDGAHIPLERTAPSFDLSALLNGFQPLFAVLSPSEVNRLSETIVRVLQGSRAEIGPLLEQTTKLTNTIADRDRVLGEVLINLSAVLSQVAGHEPELDELLARSRRLVDGLNANTGPIFGSLERVRAFTGSADDLIADLRPDLRYDLGRATASAETYLAEKPALEGTIEGLPGFLGALARITQYGSWLNLYACNLVITGPGIPPGTLGTAPGDTHSEVCR